jgi:hypothetical protein
MKTYRLDDEKVMGWLKGKMEKLVDRFEGIPALVESIAYTESLPEVCRTGNICLFVCFFLPWHVLLTDFIFAP